MSVTFFIKDHPTRISKDLCLCTQNAPEGVAPELLNLFAWEDCPACNGRGWLDFRESEWPTFNVTNVGCRLLMNMLSIPGDGGELYGELPVGELYLYRRKVVEVRNRNRYLDFVEPMEERGNVVDCGISGDRILRYLQELDTVLQFAQKQSRDVVFG